MISLPALLLPLAVWVSYSKQYDTLWKHRALADREIEAIAEQHVSTVFLTLSGAAPGLKQLADRHDPFTANLQSVLNRLAAHHVAACAAILSDNFTGTSAQMARTTAVDNVLAFNRTAAAGDARFVCVSTDLEMTAGSRTPRVYDLWKSFHASLRQRIASRGSDLKVVAWIQGPDYLIGRLSPTDRDALMAREHITVDPADTTLYDGALGYFMIANGAPVVDAVIPMWYFTPADAYQRHVEHGVRELEALKLPTLQLMPGIMVRNQSAGLCCPESSSAAPTSTTASTGARATMPTHRRSPAPRSSCGRSRPSGPVLEPEP